MHETSPAQQMPPSGRPRPPLPSAAKRAPQANGSRHGQLGLDGQAPGSTAADLPRDGATPKTEAELPQAVLVLLALLCTMLWAGAQIGVKYGLQAAPPLALMGMRFVAASVLLLPVIAYAGSPWPQTRAALGRTIVLGLLNNTVYLGLMALGIADVSAGLACVLTGLNPLLLALGGALFFQERLHRKTMLGLLGALLGVSFVMAGRLGADNTLAGAGLITAANVVMVAGNLLYKRWQFDCGLLVSHALQLLVGGITLLVLSLAFEPIHTIAFNGLLLRAELFLVFGVSFGAMLTWLFLLSRGSASKAGAFLFLVPLFGLGQGAVLLGESLSTSDVLGAAFTTLCIFYAQRAR